MYQRIHEVTRNFRERGFIMAGTASPNTADPYNEDAALRTTTARAFDIRFILTLLAAAQ